MAGRIGRDDASDAQWDRAVAISQVLGPLVGTKTRRADIDRAAAELGISTSSAYAHLKSLKADLRPTALLGGRPGRPQGSASLDLRIEEIVAEVLKRSYCSDQKPSETAVLRDIRGKCMAEGLLPPGRKLAHSRIVARDLYQRLRSREGENVAERAAPRPGGMVATRPNQIWLIDHTLADVILLDRRYRQPLGRPTLTLIIDAYTRMCVGCYASLGAPSIVQTAMALLRAFMPKEALLEAAGVAWDWPSHGFPEIVHSDNGSDFRSLAIRRGLNTYDVESHYRPVRKPRFGALIERFIGTIMGELHLVPGTTFSNVQQRGEYDSDRKAVMTLDAFEHWVLLQIARYHRSPHAGLDGFTPLSRWTEATEAGFRPRAVQPGLAEDLLLAFLPSAARKVSRTGIQFKKLRYWAVWFGPLIRKGQGSIQLRYDPRDMSWIWVLAPTGWERVHLYHRQAPFTLREHELAIAEMRTRANASWTEEDLHALRRESTEVIQAESRATRRSRRQNEHAERSIEGSQGVFALPAPENAPSSEFAITTLAPKAVVEEW